MVLRIRARCLRSAGYPVCSLKFRIFANGTNYWSAFTILPLASSWIHDTMITVQRFRVQKLGNYLSRLPICIWRLSASTFYAVVVNKSITSHPKLDITFSWRNIYSWQTSRATSFYPDRCVFPIVWYTFGSLRYIEPLTLWMLSDRKNDLDGESKTAKKRGCESFTK